MEVAVLLEASPVLVSRWIRGLKTCEDERVRRWMRELSGVRSER